MARRMAQFCVLTGQPPEVFRSLTRIERDEFIRAANGNYD